MISIVTVGHPPWLDHLTFFTKKYPEDFFMQRLDYTFSFTKKVIAYGDPHVMPMHKLKGHEVYVMIDTPLIGCTGLEQDWVYIPSSQYNREILEACDLKNVTEVIPKPMAYYPELKGSQHKYELYVNLTQPERKGHEKLSLVLHKLDGELDRRVTMLASIPGNIIQYFLGFRNIEIRVKQAGSMKYYDHLKQMLQYRILIFSSYDEGIGLPAIESALYGQQLVMGDIRATNEFVEARFAPVVEYRVTSHSVMNKHFLLQVWDEDEFYEILRKALDDPTFNVPKLKDKRVIDYEWIYKKLKEVVEF